MSDKRFLPWVGVALLVWASQIAFGQNVAPSPSAKPQPGASLRPTDVTPKQVASHVYRTGALVGMLVRNPAGETLGEMKELVLDIDSGRVSYAVLSFGGLLGLGDKLFAIPWDQLKLKHDQDGTHFVLNLPKEKLQNAPGFDKNHWPDVADANWAETVNSYYRQEQPAK
jgi:sporulation protein YlmC with PRC-barrel domain